MNNNPFRLNSLRGRYFSVAAALLIFVVFSTWFLHKEVNDVRHLSTMNIGMRYQLLVKSGNIRNQIWQVRDGLIIFLLEPVKTQPFTDISASINMALSLSHALASHSQVSSSELRAIVNAIPELIVELDNDINDLFKVRNRVAYQIDDKINPLLKDIWKHLLAFDQQIEASAMNDLKSLSNIAENQTRVLWVMAGVSCLFVIIGFFSLERSVLRPIAKVTQALISGIDNVSIQLPRPRTKEARNLIDAFLHMRDQVQSRQLALEYQALHDGLTGLPNRMLLWDRLENALNLSKRSGKALTMMMMDLDRFKEVNDTLGHHVGDNLLKQVAVRLLDTLRQADTIARLGGDEFAILLADTDQNQATQIAMKIINILEEQFQIDNMHFYVGASIGIASYPDHATDTQNLIKRADVAMYIAKRQKRGYAVYDLQQDENSIGRLALINDLREAIKNNQLILYFQPKYLLRLNEVQGAEVLLRWQHPMLGDIPPEQIIQIAEQNGLISVLSHWVLDKALQQLSLWLDKGLNINLAINLSMYNLQDIEFVTHLKEALVRYHVSADYLTFEITENAMMHNPTRTIEILSLLDAMGVNLAVDDFGTGFSSLAYLKKLPVNELKVDKSFVLDMVNDENDAVIVHSTIELAHNLGLKVTAEGVASTQCWTILKNWGCDFAQGHFLCPPVSQLEFEKLFLARKMVEYRKDVG